MGNQRIVQVLNYLLVFGACVLFGICAKSIYFELQWEYPLEIFEAAQLSSTQSILDGSQPYLLKDRPFQANVYGPLYPYFASLFALVLGNTFFTHRLIAILLIAVSGGILLQVMRTLKVALPVQFSLVGLYLFHLVHSIQSTARPDALGAFLYLLAIYLPWKMNYSRRSLILAIALALLGFYSKPYFLLSVPFIGVYFLLNGKYTRAIQLAIALACSFALSLLFVDHNFECYITEVLIIHKNAQSLFWEHMLWNLIYYFMFFAPLIFVTCSSLVQGRSRTKPVSFDSLSSVIFLLSSAVIIARMGWHAGNGIIYYHQLTTPFLIWSFAYATTLREDSDVLPKLSLCLTIIVSLIFVPLPTVASHQWKQIDKSISSGKTILVGPTLSYYQDKKRVFAFDNGQSRYLDLAIADSPLEISAQYYPQTSQFLASIRDQVRIRAFDEIIIFKDNWSLLENKRLFRKDEKEFQLFDYYKISRSIYAPVPYGAYIGGQKKIRQVFILVPNRESNPHFFAAEMVDPQVRG